MSEEKPDMVESATPPAKGVRGRPFPKGQGSANPGAIEKRLSAEQQPLLVAMQHVVTTNKVDDWTAQQRSLRKFFRDNAKAFMGKLFELEEEARIAGLPVPEVEDKEEREEDDEGAALVRDLIGERLKARGVE